MDHSQINTFNSGFLPFPVCNIGSDRFRELLGAICSAPPDPGHLLLPTVDHPPPDTIPSMGYDFLETEKISDYHAEGGGEKGNN